MMRGAVVVALIGVATQIIGMPAYGESKKDMLNCECEQMPAPVEDKSIGGSKKIKLNCVCEQVSTKKVAEEKNSKRQLLNNGLEAQLDSIGRLGSDITIAMRIFNTGENVVDLLNVGPTAAHDNTGGSYKVGHADNVTGVASCWGFSNPIECVKDKRHAPDSYTRIDPGRSISVGFKMHSFSRESKGPSISFSTVFATRVVQDPELDNGLTDEQKLKQVRLMNISFPPSPVVDAK